MLRLSINGLLHRKLVKIIKKLIYVVCITTQILKINPLSMQLQFVTGPILLCESSEHQADVRLIYGNR